ncbi:hypothetical protein [Streptomyces sp. NPDC003717]|uniref:hypothetical protein n=1 Tax=Streptomyces sp. NPDC003717 TaxID=3154276 RepID=UPI0033A7E64A
MPAGGGTARHRARTRRGRHRRHHHRAKLLAALITCLGVGLILAASWLGTP